MKYLSGRQDFVQDFSCMCQGLDTPRSLTAWLLWKYGEHRQLAELSIRAEDYRTDDWQKFRDDYLATEYLSKAQFLDTAIDTKAVALASFAANEESCRNTNIRLQALSMGARAPEVLFEQILARAQRKIENCLGPVVKWRKMLDWFRWGPGSTASLKAEHADLEGKLLETKISVTHEALPFLRAAMATDYNWLRARGLDPQGPVSLCDSEFEIRDYSRILTVPKNAKTDRTICAEPSGNIFLQLGVGQYIRRCLLRVGINLDDQGVNQSLARDAVSLGLATIDLKAASDTISQSAVWLLLPFQWASFLSYLRSPSASFSGATDAFPLEKFSAMGNGFTFELESLIFWAITSATVEQVRASGCVSVYGDDIIAPSEAVPDLLRVLKYFGFEVNTKKTHTAGPFRESCGHHYFGERNVTPIYQKDLPIHPIERMRHINRLTYHSIDRGYSPDRGPVLADSKFAWLRKVWRNTFKDPLLKKRIPRVPISASPRLRSLDAGLAVPLDWVPRYHVDSFGRAVAPGLKTKGKEKEISHAVAFAVHLRVLRRLNENDVDPSQVRFLPPEILVDERAVPDGTLRWKRIIGEPPRCLTAEPFTGTQTVRGRARTVRRHVRVSEPRNLLWV